MLNYTIFTDGIRWTLTSTNDSRNTAILLYDNTHYEQFFMHLITKPRVVDSSKASFAYKYTAQHNIETIT